MPFCGLGDAFFMPWRCLLYALKVPPLAPKDAFFFQICVKFDKHLPPPVNLLKCR